MKPMFRAALILITLTALSAAPAMAATQSSDVPQQYASAVAKNCIGNWESPACLSASSSTALTVAALYGSELQERGHSAAAEKIKEHCAAATAAREQSYPAYAMQSAYTECANMIYDVSVETSIKPQPELYQLLVSSVLCLSKDGRCASVEQGLRPYAR